MPSKYAIGALALLLIVGGSGFGGWWVRGQYEGNQDLAAERSQRAQELATLDRVREGMESAQKAMANVKGVRTVINHETTKLEYRDRPCFEPELVVLLNAAAQNLPAPASEMPGNPAHIP